MSVCGYIWASATAHLTTEESKKGRKKISPVLEGHLSCSHLLFSQGTIESLLALCAPHSIEKLHQLYDFFFFLSPWLATYLAMKCSEYCSFARNFYSSWFSSYTVRWERGVVLRQCGVQYCHNICHLKKKCNANEISYCV